MNIDVEHFRTMFDLNQWIEDLKKHYETKIKVINVSSTLDGYDLFYYIVK